MTEDTGPDVPDRDTLIAEWRLAAQAAEPLGQCQRPGCAGTVRATPPVVTRTVVWLEAECDACGYGVVRPNGKRRPEPTDGPRSPVRVLSGPGPAFPEGERDWREAAYKD
jgi:hypothetical protein